MLLRPIRNLKTDRLVNFPLILQAYFFIGILETVASFAMSYWYLQTQGIPFSSLWFSPGALPEGIDSDTYTSQLNTASSIYFVNLVIMQFFSLMAIRTRRLSVFQAPPAYNKGTQNLLLFPAMAFALCIIFVWLYIPGLQDTLGMSEVPVQFFFLPVAFGVGILRLDEARKTSVQRWPNGWVARLAW